MEGRIVLLLANLKGCRIGANYEEGGGVGGGVGRPYAVIVGRGIRERNIAFFFAMRAVSIAIRACKLLLCCHTRCFDFNHISCFGLLLLFDQTYFCHANLHFFDFLLFS